MKFHQLSIGQQFNYEGEVYTRTGPLLAANARTGAVRLIPRSASVQAVASGGSGAPAVATLNAGAVRDALAAYHVHCRRWLESVAPTLPAADATAGRTALDGGLQTALTSLGLGPQEGTDTA